MYNYCKWDCFLASRELQLVLQEDLGATITLSAFAPSSPRESEYILYKGVLCLSISSYRVLGWESLPFSY